MSPRVRQSWSCGWCAGRARPALGLGESRADLGVAHFLVSAALEAIEDGGRGVALAQERHHRGECTTYLELAARAVPPVTGDRGTLCARERRYRRITKRKVCPIHHLIQ